MTADLVERYAKPARYFTSYPTAPHLHAGVDNAVYAGWLREQSPATALSLYVHIPFCDRLCWFFGCHTTQVERYTPVAAYLPAVHREIAIVAELLEGRGHAVALHLGGGSPSILKPSDLFALVGTIGQHFAIWGELEVSIEVDPNDMAVDHSDALAAAGVTRVSIGVPDFDPQVQAAINRIQTFELTRDLVHALRRHGIRSIDLDVLYGLPHQTVASVQATVEQALSLHPDRLALFGYAQVPWMRLHQRLVEQAAVPTPGQRLEQLQAAETLMRLAGYHAIGADHFALPTDNLAIAAREGRLHQGFTSDQPSALIGIGASAIGSLPQGYVQNITTTGEYSRQVYKTGLAVARGSMPVRRTTPAAVG